MKQQVQFVERECKKATKQKPKRCTPLTVIVADPATHEVVRVESEYVEMCNTKTRRCIRRRFAELRET